MKNLSSSAAKCGPADGEPPPDLLQQLLQYTTQRMRNVSHSKTSESRQSEETAIANLFQQFFFNSQHSFQLNFSEKTPQHTQAKHAKQLNQPHPSILPL
uniref:Uncharacterized protein n=1 Tax=Knipowitschia caucasica TaxID=637954 RepID=A0AAV2JFD3_KNICA